MAVAIPSATEVAAFRACTSQADIATVLKTTLRNLRFHLYGKRRPDYHLFHIPKASGSLREIAAPPFQVLRWQRDLLPLLSFLYKPKRAVHGFVPDGSILSNAKVHRDRRLVLNFDLQDFFPSIHFGRVRGLFMKHPFGFSDTVASTLAQVCTYRGTVPQGAATSPVVSNLVCRRLDTDLARLARANDCRYTRFADDITFSTNEPSFSLSIVKSFSSGYVDVVLGDDVLEIISRHQFKVNEEKTRIQTRHRRQEVTSLVVNNETVNVRREYTRNLRFLIHTGRRDGLSAAEKPFEEFDDAQATRRYDGPSVGRHLRGKLEFLRMIRGKGDRVHAKYSIEASKLPGYGRAATIEGAAALVPEFLSEAVWIVAAYDAAGALRLNGTAFALRGVGFVTASHVIRDAPRDVARWTLVRGCQPHDEFVISAYRHDAHFDLAILLTDANAHGQLLRSKLGTFIQDQHVTIAGFPTWNSTADELLKVPAQIVQRRTWSGRKMAGVSYNLLSGASGGPALDRAGHVCGVVVTNRDDAVLPNGILSIEHIGRIPAIAILL